MRTEKKTKLVEITETKYIADDGREFTSARDCEQHEKAEKRKVFIDKAEKLRIKELEDLMPLVLDETMEHHEYRWYKLQNENDYNILSEAYSGNYFGEPASYPVIMCVETYDYYCDDYDVDAYSFTLDKCKEDTIKFWKKQGYKVRIEKE